MTAIGPAEAKINLINSSVIFSVSNKVPITRSIRGIHARRGNERNCFLGKDQQNAMLARSATFC